MTVHALRRLQALCASCWAGVIAAVGLITAPALFATLARADAGRVANRVFAVEAAVSLGFAALLLLIERARVGRAAGRLPQMSPDFVLTLGALACTVLGYYALQPMMAAARSGQATALSFAALHAVSTSMLTLKAALVLALAWRTTAR